MDSINDGDASIDGDMVVYSDGRKEPLKDVIQYVKKNNPDSMKLKDTKDKLSKTNTFLEQKDQRIIELNHEIDGLKKTIDDISRTRDIDPRTLAYVATKTQAEKLISENGYEIKKFLGELESIPDDVCDAHLAGVLQTEIGGIETSLYRLKERWSHALYMPDLSELSGGK